MAAADREDSFTLVGRLQLADRLGAASVRSIPEAVTAAAGVRMAAMGRKQ